MSPASTDFSSSQPVLLQHAKATAIWRLDLEHGCDLGCRAFGHLKPYRSSIFSGRPTLPRGEQHVAQLQIMVIDTCQLHCRTVPYHHLTG